MERAEAEKTMNNVNSNGEKLQLTVPSIAEKLVAPEDSVATTKEEEWVTKKKVELTTTRQIETRVKRQVVLEDGKIVEDTGPVVTTNTTEDTKKQEHSQTERRTLGDDDSKTDWNLTSNVFDRLKEIQEKTIKSREEREERTETEDVQHLGDMSDEGYMTAIKTGSDVRQALQVSSTGDLTETMPKIIHQSTKVKKCIDSEDKTELSRVQPGGKIVNETRTMRLHEEVNDCDISDDNSSSNADFIETTKKENFQRFYKTKKQDLTEYMENGKKIGETLHFQEETSEGEKRGDEFSGKDEDTISLKLNRIRMRSQKNKPVLTNEWINDENVPPAKKSSTFDEDEETRKEETSKWLEHHFGSESTKSSKASIHDLDDVIPSTQNSFINVTMKSQLNKPKQNSYFQNVPMFNANEKNREFPISPKTEFYLGIEPWTRKKSEDETSDPAISDRMFFSSSPVPSLVQPRAKFIIRPPGKQLENGESRTRAYLVSNSDDPQPLPNGRRLQPVSSDDSNDRIVNQNKKDGEELALCFDRREQLTLTNPNSSDATKEKEETPFVRCGPSSKKLYQRTRFAADIPPPPQPRQMPAKQKSKFGDGFRKLMDKLKSAGSERKNKKRSRSRDSRSPSPKENTYQNYNSLDNYGSLMHRSDVDDYGRCSEEPVPPPRTKQNLSRSHRETRIPEKSVQRYYLGEDPFLGSIYGREKEYECRPMRTRERKRGGTESEEENDSKAKTLGRFSKSTSRLLNSERPSDAHLQSRGGVQTLPRKFREEKLNKINDSEEEENKSKENDTWIYEHSKPRISVEKPMTHARSLINVSIVNRSNSPSRGNLRGFGSEGRVPWQGPAKPARTYRTNLSRSQSFNVQPHHKNSLNAYKSNFQLYGLEESPAPLESPSMIYRWSRNGSYLDKEESISLNPGKMGTRTRDIQTVPTGITFDDPIGANLTSASRTGKESRPDLCYSNSFRTTSTIKTNDSNPSIDGPQSLHFKTNWDAEDGVFTRTFRDGNVTKTVSRSGSFGKDDYSETVRIESKSEDPLNPSETNTVKIFSKKKVPTKGGCGFETIESSETKTVVKSQTMRNGTLDNERVLYNSSPTGVVIKVRNISD